MAKCRTCGIQFWGNGNQCYGCKNKKVSVWSREGYKKRKGY